MEKAPQILAATACSLRRQTQFLALLFLKYNFAARSIQCIFVNADFQQISCFLYKIITKIFYKIVKKINLKSTSKVTSFLAV